MVEMFVLLWLLILVKFVSILPGVLSEIPFFF